VRRPEKHDGVYNTFGRTVMQDQISEDSVRRRFKTEIIVFVQEERNLVSAIV